MCAEHVCMFTEMSFLSYLTADRMMDHFFLRSWKVIASRSCVLPVLETVYMITDLFLSGERYSEFCVKWCTSDLFLCIQLQFLNPLPSCIHTYLQGFMMTHFGNQRRLYYSYRLYQLGNLHEKWRWQFTGSHKCVIRFRTEIGQADDCNSLHDREREESTKSLSLPVTVCYVNSCNISDLFSFNLIISACLCFGA